MPVKAVEVDHTPEDQEIIAERFGRLGDALAERHMAKGRFGTRAALQEVLAVFARVDRDYREGE